MGIRCLIGTVFIVSSISKVAGRSAFGQFVASVRGLRPPTALPVVPTAVVVVAAEFAVCALLCANLVVVGYALAVALLVGFSVAIAGALARGVRASCRCFGSSGALLGRHHIARNAGLALVAACGLVVGHPAGGVQPGGVVLAVLAGLILGGLVAVLDDIVDLFRPLTDGAAPPRRASVTTPPAAGVESGQIVKSQ
ncbi:MauE/DoxX family redox-associated membrane protein [Rugosimonospora africana]|uniref:MauE/DoxX family redox-associated membrane protein n=1 Tax=Rugosimonospora africana TaxID=556532 RepID=UPI0019456092|nr:MauE/DoxX family redox-associated membrane protein [Rugosimonospora africana]